MRSSANEGVKVVFWNAEVNVYAVKNILRHVTENVLRHFYVDVTRARVLVSLGKAAYLYASGIERRIRVLIAADQHNVLEPV